MEQKNSPVLKQKSVKSRKTISISVVIAVAVLVLTGAILAVWSYQKKNQVFGEHPGKEERNKLTSAESQDISRKPKNNRDDKVEWYPNPRPIPNIKLTKDDSEVPSYKMWEAGKILRGKKAGAKVILMASDPEGPGPTEIFRFIKDEMQDDKRLEFLMNYSSNNILDFYGTDLDTEKIWDYPNTTTRIVSLDFPGVYFAPKGDKLVKAEEFPSSGEGNDGILFKADLLKKVFTDPIYGDFYTTNPSKKSEDSFYGSYADYGFYVKAPDGTFKVYTVPVEFMGEKDIPQIVWNDGTANASPFTYQGAASCGSAVYADIVDGEVDLSNLAATGKTNTGDAVYEFKDKNDKYLKNFFDEDVNYLKDNPDIAEGKKFTKAMTYDQFVSSHVVFFWKDPFGRLMRFINTDYFIDPGGCGKPVIYLYPEKEQEISVKVSPTGGFTKTEPEYGAGWNVIADPLGRIKNIADGKTYPYLFWEGNSDEIYQTSKFGFVADRDGLESLLNEKLVLLGLNQKEIGDFKEFWLHKLLVENKPYYFITFVPQKKIDVMAPLKINPRPDTVIRVMMDWKGLDEKIDAPGFEIKTPERKGFTAVEWGGMLK